MLNPGIADGLTESNLQTKKLSRTLTCGGLFAGIGGFCSGFEKAGYSTSWCIDISEDAEKTYKLNFPNITYLRQDVKAPTTEAKNLEPVDVLHAGFPCQSFSAAGFRQGFEDPRGQLFYEIPRLLAEWGDSRPRVVVLENSLFLKHGEGGSWFKEVQTKIRRSGYWFSEKNCFELDTYEHGRLPQKRKRLFMIAVRSDAYDFNGIDLSDVKADVAIELSSIIQKNIVDESYYLPSENRYNTMIGKQVNESDPYQIYQLRKYLVRLPESGVCPTLTANMGQGGHNVPFILQEKRLRKLTEFECLALQGFPDSFRFPEDVVGGKRYTLIGNAVSPSVSGLIATKVRDFINRN